MVTKEEALKLALEALTYIHAETSTEEDALIDEAIIAIEEALAQPAQEARNFCPRCGKRLGGDVNYIHTCTPPRGLEMT